LPVVVGMVCYVEEDGTPGIVGQVAG
jgi:hypothetical protein